MIGPAGARRCPPSGPTPGRAWGSPPRRLGPAAGPVVVLALPLFEEANRTRTFAVGLLRKLADRGVGGVLPDLPGQNESVVATEHAMLAGWRAAFAAAAAATGRTVHSVTMRGGSLIDH